MDKYWYALLNETDDKDWSKGTFDLQEAKELLIRKYPVYTMIAVVDAAYDEDGKETAEPICVDVISYKDICGHMTDQEMNPKQLRQMAGMTQKAFYEYFGIPRRTVENWDAGVRKCPDYLLELMLYKLKNEGLIKE